MDVNVERAEDVLMHMKLLEKAIHPENQPAFSVRIVQVHLRQKGEQLRLVCSCFAAVYLWYVSEANIAVQVPLDIDASEADSQSNITEDDNCPTPRTPAYVL